MSAEPIERPDAGTVDATTAYLVGRLLVMEELVRWLSLPFGDNEPIFAGADGFGTTDGQPLGTAAAMHTMWHQVTGRPHVEVGAEDHRTWRRCERCGHYHVEM